MTRPPWTTAAEIAAVIAYGPGALGPALRPAVCAHLRLVVSAAEETIAEHAAAGVPLADDAPEVEALRRARQALTTLIPEP